MEEDSKWKMIISPAVAPMTMTSAEGSGDNNWEGFNNTSSSSSSANSVSFGFLATAILVSMFLVMAVVERFFRKSSPAAAAAPGETGFRVNLCDKHQYPSPKMVPASDISVLMPGETIPTFIAHPVPPPSPCTSSQTPNLS